jgi:hypothetical protein
MMKMFPIDAMDWSPNQLFEYMTGRKIKAEPNIDRLHNEGRINFSDAEGWSMGNCMDAVVVRVTKAPGAWMSLKKTNKFQLTLATRRDMLEAIDIPAECRFESEDIDEISVRAADAPPHIHNRRCNWTRWLRIGYDSNNASNDMYVFVFYENWADSALYAGNVLAEELVEIGRYLRNLSLDNGELILTEDIENEIILSKDVDALIHKNHEMWHDYPDPNPEEVHEQKTARNRAKRERRKERKRELAAEKAEEQEQRELDRKDRDDGIEGIHKGKKGHQQLAEEEAELRRKELAESHREWERLHPKSERITVRGDSHTETPKAPKPDPTIEELIARMDFEEKRGDRHAEAEKKKAEAHAEALQRRKAEAKAAAEDVVKKVGMRLAEAANPKAPPMTLARKAGL